MKFYVCMWNFTGWLTQLMDPCELLSALFVFQSPYISDTFVVFLPCSGLRMKIGSHVKSWTRAIMHVTKVDVHAVWRRIEFFWSIWMAERNGSEGPSLGWFNGLSLQILYFFLLFLFLFLFFSQWTNKAPDQNHIENQRPPMEADILLRTLEGVGTGRPHPGNHGLGLWTLHADHQWIHRRGTLHSTIQPFPLIKTRWSHSSFTDMTHNKNQIAYGHINIQYIEVFGRHFYFRSKIFLLSKNHFHPTLFGEFFDE